MDPSTAQSLFFFLVALYSFVWVPSFYGYYWLKDKADENAQDGHVAPPEFVLIAIIIIFLLFSLFPLAYARNMAAGLPRKIADLIDREKWYTLASMIAKVSLHAVIGFAVIGQSAALDSVKSTQGNVTRLKSSPTDDGTTLRNILIAVGSAVVGLSLITYLALRTKKKTQEKALIRLHGIAAAVHLISASVILAVAWAETDGNLKRYRARPDLGRFLRPEEWRLQCYNEKTKLLLPERAAKCPGDLVDVFTNKHRGEGPVNIAWLAFAFAAWSGFCHLLCTKDLLQTDWVNIEGIGEQLAKRRWTDYILSAPLMLVTLNIIFAATNLGGVIIAPLLLVGLEAGAAALELSEFNPVPVWMLQTVAYKLML